MLAPNCELEVGRDGPVFGSGALATDRLSRRHARFFVDAHHRLTVTDLDSHNGTRLNGHRVRRAELTDGDLVALGGILVHAVRCAPNFAHRPVGVALGLGPSAHALADAVAIVAQRNVDVVLVGESGSGKDFLARNIAAHQQSEHWCHLDATADDNAALGAQLRRHPKTTLYVDGLEACSESALQLLRSIVMDTQRDPNVRIIGACRRPLAELSASILPPELGARLGRWTIAVPPIRARREDIPSIVTAIIGSDEPPPRIHPRLMEALCLRSWPTNWHGLQAAIAQMTAAGPAGRELKLSDFETAPRSPSRTSSAALRIHAQGLWVQPAGATRKEVSGRPALRRIVVALLESRSQDPYRRLTTSELARAGWPSDDASDDVLVKRLYTAVSTLRNLGLRDAIERTAEGYRLTPELSIELVD